MALKSKNTDVSTAVQLTSHPDNHLKAIKASPFEQLRLSLSLQSPHTVKCK